MTLTDLIVVAIVGGIAGAATTHLIAVALKRSRWRSLESIVDRERATAAYQAVIDRHGA